MDAADRIKLYGTDEKLPPVGTLIAGALSADFLAGGLRAIRWRGVEVLRAVAYVVRDRDWGTYAPAVEDLAVTQRDDGFRLSYTASCQAADGATLRFAAEIAGDAEGRLAFTVEALPDADFETNRCGFCILHPITGLAGQPATVTHTDGTVEPARFPDLIEPWQPFQDVRAIAHIVLPGTLATCTMVGDSFEMEDQRAWSDASYKTYVRPLALPWPYVLPAGETNRQSIVLDIAETSEPVPAAQATRQPAGLAEPVAISLGEDISTPMPRFGVSVSPAEAEAAWAGRDRLQALAPRHLLLSFDPAAGHGAADLEALARVADALPRAAVTLEITVPGIGDPAAELADIATAVRAAGLRHDAVMVSPAADRQSTPPGSDWPACPPLEMVYAAARAAFPGVLVGGGMLSYFTELNRKRVPAENLDFVAHSTCPIVHAADDLSVMQTLEAIPFITRSTRAFIYAKAYHLGPTTIGMRQNPYGSRTMDNPDGRRIAMAHDDPRQRGLFAAAWLVGYAARFVESDVSVWTGASFAGPRGLLVEGEKVVPAFHVATALAQLSGLPRHRVVSGDRTRIDGFAARHADGSTEFWLANLTAAPQRLDLGRALPSVEMAMLDLDSFAEAADGKMPARQQASARLTLGPYAVACLTVPAA